MGYTNYWYRPTVLDQDRFDKFSEDAKSLALGWEGPIADGAGVEGSKPRFDHDEVTFNGVEDDAHEAFHIPRVFDPPSWRPEPDEDGLHFDFCKTARKPYDTLVCAVLIAFKHHFPEVVVASDGNWGGYNFTPKRWDGKNWVPTGEIEQHEAEWEDGRHLYKRVFPDRDADTSILTIDD